MVRDPNFKTVGQIKVEAIKVFVERLKKEFLTLEYQVNTTRKTLPIDFAKALKEIYVFQVYSQKVMNRKRKAVCRNDKRRSN